MENFDFSKLKLASLTDRIKTSSSELTRTITTKVKEILQTPTPESKIVDEATSETLDSPNWGLNLRICSMIGRGEYDGTEIVRSIKRKLVPGKYPAVCHGLSLFLLETLTSNCDKVFSEVASEKVLDDMIRLIEDGRTEEEVRSRAMGMIRAWGESEDLVYLPVFRQTYMHLKTIKIPPPAQEESHSSSMRSSLESYLGFDREEPISPPERYPIPTNTGSENAAFISYGFQSIEEKKEFLAVARNSLDILSSILNSETEPKPIEDDLTVTMLNKCKQSMPVIQRIIESTSDDEVMLFDALNLHDELQLVISRCAELEAVPQSGQPENHNSPGDLLSGDSNTNDATLPMQSGSPSTTELADNPKVSGPGPVNQSHQEEIGDKSAAKSELPM